MPIELVCACGKRMKAPDEAAGRSAQCPACGKTVDIPSAAAGADEIEVVEDDAPEANAFDFSEKSKKKKKKRKKKKLGVMSKEEEREMYDELRAGDARRNRVVVNTGYLVVGLIILAGMIYMWAVHKDDVKALSRGLGPALPIFLVVGLLGGIASVLRGAAGLIFGQYFNPYTED